MKVATGKEGVGCLVVLLVLGLTYLASVFNRFFESAKGYVYHPATDNLYRIEFTHSPLPIERWRYFVPTFGPRPMDPAFIEYVGVRGALHKESADRMRLLLEDPAEYARVQAHELEEIREAMKESANSVRELRELVAHPSEERMRLYMSKDVLLSADLSWRPDLNPRDMLPEGWSTLGNFADSSDRLLSAADLVIVKMRYGSPVEVEIAHEVLVVEGSAARRLAALGPW